MSEWADSKPLSEIIANSVRYNKNHNKVIKLTKPYTRDETFDENNVIHMNQFINGILNDIENILTFKVKNYVLNYLSLVGN